MSEKNRRLKQFRQALADLEGNRNETLSECLLRTLRLLELCPWLQDDTPPAEEAPNDGKRKPHHANSE